MGKQPTLWEGDRISLADSLELTATPRTLVVAAQAEAFILANHGLTLLPAVGSRGTITFMQGGPTGGYWQFTSGN